VDVTVGDGVPVVVEVGVTEEVEVTVGELVWVFDIVGD
jgi:hypothetical protein